MESSAALTQSMHHITTTKLTALSKQQQRYDTDKAKVLEAVSGESNLKKKLTHLLDAFDHYKIPVPSNLSLANIRHFLDQSNHDPSVSPQLLQEWQRTLEKALDIPSHKFKHASLFGRLVMEWLDKTGESPSESTASDGTDPFEHVGRKEMYDQRKEWESIVFSTNSKSDPAAINKYLETIFGSTGKAKKMVKSPLEMLRDQMRSFELGKLDVDDLKLTIAGVLKTDLLSDAKRKTLAEFSGNPMILSEMVDVLNMEIDTLDTWSWGDEAVPVDVRRSLNGKYRVYMDEEISQALLLHFIGMKWGVHIKTACLAFFNSGAWKQSSRQSLNRLARQRRQDFLGREQSTNHNVRNERRESYQREYFLLQLPASFESTIDNYDNEPNDNYGESKSAMAMKQSLLHLISTEALVNTRLYGSFTILQSDFKWFGPSMPHATIVTVLRFFGVSDLWLNFFEKFLKAPIKFAMDGTSAQVQVRQCGVPIQHRLGDALNESVLFCLDFAVNKATQSNLFRLHDDIWYYGSKDATVGAWEVIKQFAHTMGLSLNEGKTGAMELSGSPVAAREFEPSDRLPSGPITWGFLKIGPSGKWIIDDAYVQLHTDELKLQLEATKSIFAWVQAWNAYAARFLSNNVGEPANCLGRSHLDDVIGVMEKIQNKLFVADGIEGDNVIAHLRRKLDSRFGSQDVPDGFFLFPIELGGLGLINPLISLFGLYKKSLENPKDLIEKAIEEDEVDYERARKAFAEGTSRPGYRSKPTDSEDFMSLEEFTNFREETSVHLWKAYKELMGAPVEAGVESTPDLETARRALPLGSTSRLGLYDNWVMELYGPDVIRRYGGLAMGEKRLLPVGLAETLKSQKVRWQG
ncbi:hypothetical protein G7Y79_00030g064840 [Physcia stellaris]|nr:hypothetical protein G7Y79_00030g064840 [Physcia stellaris]